MEANYEEKYFDINRNNLNDSYETIECYYNDKGEFVTTVSTQYEVSAEYDEYIETMLRLILGYSYDGKGSEIPIIFDGVSGELLIEDNQVLNISMY